jgi:hypothetical protein
VFVKTSVFVTDKRKAPACGKICPFFVNYESLKFYSTGPRMKNVIVVFAVTFATQQKQKTKSLNWQHKQLNLSKGCRKNVINEYYLKTKQTYILPPGKIYIKLCKIKLRLPVLMYIFIIGKMYIKLASIKLILPVLMCFLQTP